MKKLIGRNDVCFRKLYNSLRKRFGLEYEETLEEVDKVFEEKTFCNLPVILVSNDDTFSKEFIAELNSLEGYQAFGYYREGNWAYNSVDEVREMIPRLLEDDDNSKKFIYVSVDLRSKFKLDIPGTICIKQGLKDGDLYLDIVKNRKVIVNEVIRGFCENDIREVNVLLRQLYSIRWSVRPDIFDKDFSLSYNDAEKLCARRGGSHAMVCVRDGKIVGVAFYEDMDEVTTKWVTKDRVLVIKDIYVLKEYRRCGIATRMYLEILKKMNDFRCRKCRFKVWDGDVETKLFIASLHPKKLYTLYELDI